ncbi:type II toxin-antitoxin system RelE/ParE family toxin [Streptomyces smaragdinus]|uniref:type II toxin-antitoxin system RelE/ParE family toxin n=1 Tax=Streptomyces smaragdinus TaxID=2585196 RepID=UPI002B214476|nr:type II toxin-antitoxin system RelE/ParE family toxin [Streptomyces smaragdinus]
MSEFYEIELEPEVAAWPESLSTKHFDKIDDTAGLLAELGPTTPMPIARPLRDGVWELRLALGDTNARITYWFAPGRRIVFLTWFRKTRQHEEKQIDRAVLARKQCEAEHEPASGSFHRATTDGRSPMSGHQKFKTLRDKRLRGGYGESAERAQARRENLLAMALAVVVYQRRTELGLTQAETAERCGLDQGKISRIEGSDAVPTLALLYKLSRGLDGTFHIDIDDDADEPVITLTAHGSGTAA